jgi:hypothetical protein
LVKRGGKASEYKSYARTASFIHLRQRHPKVDTVAGIPDWKTCWTSNLSLFPPWKQL